jgi:hypothetical protein
MKTIEPGAGFWNVTRYPYGGDFGRASREKPLPVRDQTPAGRPGESTVVLLEACGHNKAGDRVVVRDQYLKEENASNEN